MAKIGYARVSTLKQDLNEQIAELEKFGCTKIFSGKHSGKSEQNEEQLNELLNYIREEDVVVVTKLDRLGRSLSQCLKVLGWLIFSGVQLSLAEPLLQLPPAEPLNVLLS